MSNGLHSKLIVLGVKLELGLLSFSLGSSLRREPRRVDHVCGDATCLLGVDYCLRFLVVSPVNFLFERLKVVDQLLLVLTSLGIVNVYLPRVTACLLVVRLLGGLMAFGVRFQNDSGRPCWTLDILSLDLQLHLPLTSPLRLVAIIGV